MGEFEIWEGGGPDLFFMRPLLYVSISPTRIDALVSK